MALPVVVPVGEGTAERLIEKLMPGSRACGRHFERS
jgi:hypothetical protein